MPKTVANSGPFVEVLTKLYIHLPPCFAIKPMEGIQEQLNGFLMRYMPQVDGVVLAHSDTKLLDRAGRIMNDSPYSHFWISVKLLVWKPVKGSTLRGTINLQSPDHIGLLLYGTFNASIPSEFIPKDKYVFDPSSTYNQGKQQGEDDQAEDSAASINGLMNGEWVLKSTRESIGHDGVIEFEVSDLVRTHDMLAVTGSLMRVPVTLRRASVMVKHSPVVDSASLMASATSQKRSAPEDDGDETVAPLETDAKRIKKEKKKEKKEKHNTAVVPEVAAAPEAAALPEVVEVKKEKKDKKDKKDKKVKKVKAEA